MITNQYERMITSYYRTGILTVLYCIVSINLYSASLSAHQSEALPVRTDPEKRKRSSDDEKRYLAHQLINRNVSKEEANSRANARVLAIAVLSRGTKRSCRFNEMNTTCIRQPCKAPITSYISFYQRAISRMIG